jgi:hypothetical protein
MAKIFQFPSNDSDLDTIPGKEDENRLAAQYKIEPRDVAIIRRAGLTLRTAFTLTADECCIQLPRLASIAAYERLMNAGRRLGLRED